MGFAHNAQQLQICVANKWFITTPYVDIGNTRQDNSGDMAQRAHRCVLHFPQISKVTHRHHCGGGAVSFAFLQTDVDWSLYAMSSF